MDGRRATAGPISVALGVVLLIGALRLWLPVSLGSGDGGPIEVVLLVLAPLLVAFVVAPALTAFVGPGRLLLGAAAVLATARLILQPLAGDATDLRVVVALLVVTAAAVWLGAVAAGGTDRRAATLGLVAGVGLDVVLHAALGTVDAVWRADAIGWLVLVAVTVGFAGSTWLARTGETPARPVASAWPWLAAGPFLALHLLIATSPHLTTLGGLDPRVALGVLVVAHLVAIASAASLITTPSRGLVLGSAGLLLLALAATLATQMPFETPTVHALGTATIVVTAAVCMAALASAPGGGSAAGGAGATLAGLAVAVLLVLAHDAQLIDAATGLGVWGAAVAVAAVGLAALRPATLAPAHGHPALIVGLSIVAIGGVGLVAETARVTTPAGTTGAQIVLVHQNVGPTTGHELAHGLVASLDERAPEVVTLTHVPRGALTSGGVDPVGRVAAQLGLSPLVTRTDRLLRGDVILGRAATTETRVEPLPGGGVALVAVLALHPQEVAVVTASVPAGSAETERQDQVRRVTSIVDDLDRLQLPTLLAGTFWRPPDAPELEPLRDRIRSLSARGLPEPTWPAHSPRVAMDHIYIGDGLLAGDLVIGPASIGSHLPVAVGVRVTDDP